MTTSSTRFGYAIRARGTTCGCKRGTRVTAKAWAGLSLFTPAKDKLLVDDILDIISDDERGLRASKKSTEQVRKAVAALREETAGKDTWGCLSANWELLWTTEKVMRSFRARETLFIVDKAKLFGTEAGPIFQRINTKEGSLSNEITFPPDGSFNVSAIITKDGQQRVNFKFTGAAIERASGPIRIPPFGQGWFENVYVGKDYRIAEDSRGDILVTRRR